MNQDYMIKLEAFEGPLDLLLHLIRKNEVNIYDIPIAKITEEYIKTIEEMKEMNLDVAGEFLIMASTLIYIKSRMLLPIYREDGSGDVIEEDPREELVKLLLEYQKYQEAGKKLGEHSILGRDTFKNPKTKTKITKEDRPLENLELFQLISAYQVVVNKYKDKFNTYNVKVPIKSLKEKLTELKEKYKDGFKSLKLEDILTNPISKNEIVVSFLAMLELARLGFLKIMQVDASNDILISTNKALDKLNLDLIEKNEFLSKGVITEDGKE
jgi:segregation and condensation protein A